MGATGRLNRDKVLQITRLGGCKNFVGKRQEFVFNAFCYCEPVKRAQGGGDVTGFGSFDNSTSKRVLNLLEASYFRLWEVVI